MVYIMSTVCNFRNGEFYLPTVLFYLLYGQTPRYYRLAPTAPSHMRLRAEVWGGACNNPGVDPRSKVTLQTSFRVLYAEYIGRIIACIQYWPICTLSMIRTHARINSWSVRQEIHSIRLQFQRLSCLLRRSRACRCEWLPAGWLNGRLEILTVLLWMASAW